MTPPDESAKSGKNHAGREQVIRAVLSGMCLAGAILLALFMVARGYDKSAAVIGAALVVAARDVLISADRKNGVDKKNKKK